MIYDLRGTIYDVSMIMAFHLKFPIEKLIFTNDVKSSL